MFLLQSPSRSRTTTKTGRSRWSTNPFTTSKPPNQAPLGLRPDPSDIVHQCNSQSIRVSTHRSYLLLHQILLISVLPGRFRLRPLRPFACRKRSTFRSRPKSFLGSCRHQLRMLESLLFRRTWPPGLVSKKSTLAGSWTGTTTSMTLRSRPALSLFEVPLRPPTKLPHIPPYLSKPLPLGLLARFNQHTHPPTIHLLSLRPPWPNASLIADRPDQSLPSPPVLVLNPWSSARRSIKMGLTFLGSSPTTSRIASTHRQLPNDRSNDPRRRTCPPLSTRPDLVRCHPPPALEISPTIILPTRTAHRFSTAQSSQPSPSADLQDARR